MNRRHFIRSAVALPFISAIAAEKPKRLILRSSWQTVNIGDIAHTPGVLALLEKHLPEVEVRLWPSKLDNGVAEMLAARFPKVKIIQGEEVKKSFDECDFLLHGSGPSLVAQNDVLKWRKATGKPYGVYGITSSSQGSTSTTPSSDKSISSTIDVLSGAKFAYFRDSVSLELAKSKGCTCPLMEFGPDGAFAVDLKDDAKAEAFLKANGLEEGKFLCCIPRLRFTPYWTLPEKKAAKDETKHARNEAMKEHDCKPLRDAIVKVIQQTDLKILLCPEDKTQMAVNKEMLYDKLPEDVKARVVWRENYWLTDEAISTYRRSAGLFGHEMHSPIMCIGNGIPAIVCRWAEQTSKGFMWRDIGLNEWLFDLDKEDELARVADTVLAMAKDPAGSKAKAAKARDFVMGKFAASMQVVRKNLPD
ncbi:polysaccharide pyruvyl transferase family protein [Prosthecobacter sp.]|jgi:polysaccharide pyruvyl transferase WcaK-like protein|uniref:polysaccharide pyruvyl transferase family protein n=1 Tax=Prosthecobacter sp. TaxID=1965333 RepID=UPI0037846908